MIRQFDVLENPIRALRADRPYLVCIQHDHLGHLKTRLTAPLANKRVIAEESRLHPAISVERKSLFLLPHDLLALPLRLLGEPVANIEAGRERIIAALDLVLTGV